MGIKVVISPGFGGGFSADLYDWTSEERFKLVTHPQLIEAVENGEATSELISQICKELGKPRPYLGGLFELKVVEVPKGSLFRINEYNGHESVEIFNKKEWWKA